METSGGCLSTPGKRSALTGQKLDLEGTYPNVQAGLNIGKETTHKEIGQIDGLDEYWKRSIGVNLTAGITNCMEIGMIGFSLPSPQKVIELFEQHLQSIAQDRA